MTKYEALKQKADNYKNRLAFAIAYRDNLENGTIVSTTNAPEGHVGQPFRPFLSNRVASYYGTIDTDEFTENEMGVLKELVICYVARLEQQYEEVAVKLQAVEELLS